MKSMEIQKQQVFSSIHLFLYQDFSIIDLSKKLGLNSNTVSELITQYLKSDRPVIQNDIIEIPSIDGLLLDSNIKFWEGSNGLTVADWNGMNKLEKQIYECI